MWPLPILPMGRGTATKIAELWLARPFTDILGVEHRRNEVLPGDGERRKYGDTIVTIFRHVS